MSHTLDVLADVEHGTVEGYRQGCRTSHCPAGEFGLSCIRANTLAAGNWQYLKAVQRGLTPREVAELLGLSAPAAVVAMIKEKTVAKKTEAAPKPSQKEARAWAREVGIEVPARGTLPRSVMDAYNARGMGVQAADVKPVEVVEVLEPLAEAQPQDSADEAPVEAEPLADVVEGRADWSLPLTSYDLRTIAAALEAVEKVPLDIVDLNEIPVNRPGGADVIGHFRLAAHFDGDEAWLGFVPLSGAV